MTEATTILYLSHGRDEFHLQAQLSILTLLHFLRDSDLDYRLVVYTDAPWKFEKYGVETVVLDEDQIRQWRGAYNFVHRVKIMTLADASERFGGNLFFIDADTYFTSSPVDLIRSIRPGRSLMMEAENIIGKNHFPELYRFLRKHKDELQMERVDGVMMWNAGILGIHSSHAARSLAEVLRITDLVCSGLDKHINEQFAFSYVLQTDGEVVPTAALLVHYCGDVDHVLSRFREFLVAHRDAELADLCAAAVTLDARADVQHRKTTSAERVLAVFTRLGRSIRKRVRRLRRRRALGE